MLWLLAHALHLGLVVVGLAGLAVLLGPQLRERHAGGRYRAPATVDEHRARVDALRASLADPQPRVQQPPTWARPLDSSPWRAFAVVSSMAAAIVHAAVAPHHFLEAGLLVGFFFLGAAAWQAYCAWQLSREVTPRLLWLAIAGNVALIALWAWSRTTGLPLGFTSGPEEIGPWDLSAVTWQLCVVVACWRGLRARSASTLVLGRLGVQAWTWAGLSGLVLLVLSLTVAVE